MGVRATIRSLLVLVWATTTWAATGYSAEPDKAPPLPVMGTLPTSSTSEGVSLSPADGLMLAAGDVTGNPYCRYLWLGDIPAEEREMWILALKAHLPHLSTQPQIVLPAFIVPNDANLAKIMQGTLLRIDVRDYGGKDGGVFGKAWETLERQDPIFHTILNYPHTVWQGSEWYREPFDPGKGKPTEWVQASQWVKGKDYPALAPWLTETPQHRAAIDALVARTVSPLTPYGSHVPIVHGAWFLWQTAVQLDRKPGYRDFLGYKNEREFDTLVGFDAKLLERFPIELAEAVGVSTVTRGGKPRAVVRFGKIGGSLFKTLDVNIPKDKSNPLEIYDPDRNLKFDATEQMGHLPNGFLAFGLFNNKGDSQDVVPQEIAFDHHGVHNDFNVHLGTLSCNRCHNLAGFNDVEGWSRTVVNKFPLELGTTDPKEYDRRYIYTASLEDALEEDRARVTRAVFHATGTTPAKAFKAIADGWEQVAAPIGTIRAARYLGVPRERMVRALDKFLRDNKSIDPVIATYLRPERAEEAKRALVGLVTKDGPRPLQPDVFFGSYPLLQLALRNYVPLQELKP